MNALYIATQPLVEGAGISNKIRSQYKAFLDNGFNMDICYQRIEKDGSISYYVGENWLFSLGTGLRAHLALYYKYSKIVSYVKEKHIKFVYIRYIQLANPFFNIFLKQIKKSGATVYLEIPTYPYDGEYTQGFLKIVQKRIEKRYRSSFYKYVDRIVTFTDEKTIFDILTVNISNGLDMEKVPLRVVKAHEGINLVGVAMLSKWHGYDRIIEGMYLYYQNGGKENVQFYIIGAGETVIEDYKSLVEKYNLGAYVHFEGVKSGRELVPYFDIADIAIGCLACHRKKVKSVKSLKNVEYAARGVVFTYSEENADFDDSPYVLKQVPNETPIDIESLISFIKENSLSPSDIRKTIEYKLSWKHQMKIVSESINMFQCHYDRKIVGCDHH